MESLADRRPPALRTAFSVFMAIDAWLKWQPRTLKEFVALQTRFPVAALEGHAQRGDFSRWIHNVFGDEPLAFEIRQVEKDFRQELIANLSESLAAPVHQRYGMRC